LEVIAEIDVGKSLEKDIQLLRNSCFPNYSVNRSYYKQLPHYRALEYEDEQLVGYMGIDYRVVAVDAKPLKIFGVIDFCVAKNFRGNGIGNSMLSSLYSYAEAKDIEFIILIADDPRIYVNNGFKQIKSYSSWLRINEHVNYGVSVEYLSDLYAKQVGQKIWPVGHVDWLGYQF